MLIDTTKLKEAVSQHEEDLLQRKYGGDWEICPMIFLNSSEARVLRRALLIAEIENLYKELVSNPENDQKEESSDQDDDVCWLVHCPQCGTFKLIQKKEPESCPKCQGMNIDTCPEERE